MWSRICFGVKSGKERAFPVVSVQPVLTLEVYFLLKTQTTEPVKRPSAKEFRMSLPKVTTFFTLLTIAGLIAVAAILVRFQPTTALAAEGSFRAAKHTLIKFDVPGAGNGANQGTIGAVVAGNGSVAGWYYDASSVAHGYLRSASGTFTKFDPAGSVGTLPNAMNSKLAIVGYYYDANNVYHGFARTPQGKLATIDDPEAGTASGQGTYAWSMNTSGEVTGYYIDSSNVYHGFMLTPSGDFTTFDVPGAGTTQYQGTQPASTDGITDAGAIAGTYSDIDSESHGFLRTPDGTYTSFDPAGSFGTYVSGINSSDTITGIYVDLNGSHGFVRTVDGTITSFDVLIGTLGFSVGTINAAGAITGWYDDSRLVTHGYLRNANGQITTGSVPGAGNGRNQGTLPFANNSAGAITGYYQDSNNVYHGFLEQ
jgi:hypothetical protein